MFDVETVGRQSAFIGVVSRHAPRDHDRSRTGELLVRQVTPSVTAPVFVTALELSCPEIKPRVRPATRVYSELLREDQKPVPGSRSPPL